MNPFLCQVPQVCAVWHKAQVCSPLHRPDGRSLIIFSLESIGQGRAGERQCFQCSQGRGGVGRGSVSSALRFSFAAAPPQLLFVEGGLSCCNLWKPTPDKWRCPTPDKWRCSPLFADRAFFSHPCLLELQNFFFFKSLENWHAFS